jgi:hypothetical protein
MKRHAASVALALLALVFAALAVETMHWRHAAGQQDALLRDPADREQSWRAATSTGTRAAEALLGVGDAVAFRQAVAGFKFSRPLTEGASKGGDQLEASAAAEALLARVEREDASASRRAGAATMLGILTFEDSLYDRRNENLHLEQSEAAFQRAVRLDPRRVDAKFDLELLLRLIAPKQGRPGGQRGGGGFGEGASGAGFSQPGHGY